MKLMDVRSRRRHYELKGERGPPAGMPSTGNDSFLP